MELTYQFPLFVAAWFLQMGLHEGGHAYAAYYLGDDTSYLLGKRSINPLDHVEWENLNSILMSVIVPILTAAYGMVPMGMASVPVNPNRLRKRDRDMAMIAFAGPLGNFVLMGCCLALHQAVSWLPYRDMSMTFAGGGHQGWDLGAVVWLFDELFYCVYLTSALYAFFNILPLPPLDGSSVMRYFLPRAGRDLLDAIRPYGFTILMLLFWVGNAGVILKLPLMLVLLLW